MRITADDGVGLEMEVAGTGPGLVLVHGLGGAKEDWSDHVPALARDHTVVIFDHRGHGASDNPDEPAAYSVDRLVRDTLMVADAAGLDTFRLLGHSMGGLIARTLVLQHPDRVDALIMMDTSAGPIPGFDPALMDLAAEHGLTHGKDALKELLDFAQALETPAYKELLLARPGYEEFCDRKWDDLSHVMWSTMARELAYQRDDLPALAAEVTRPVLIIVGEQDEPFVAAAHQMASAMPHAQLVIVPDAGHSPQFENAPVWIDTITRFLASVSAPAR
jgi:pimeloyl-ACP methyl ester carboxylesterase